MRVRSTAALAVTAAVAFGVGPLLASFAGQGPAAALAAPPTSPETIPMTTTTGTQTLTSAAKTKYDICLTKARDAVARSLGVGTRSVTIARGRGSNGMPQCSFTVMRPQAKSIPHTPVHLLVNVDSAPQAGWRLMRKVVEASQLFGPEPKGWHAPIGLYGLGQYASWFINLDALMCVNHTQTQLLTVTVDWKEADRGQMIKLARATVEPYVHAPATALPIPNSGY